MRNQRVALFVVLLLSIAYSCNNKGKEIELLEQGKGLFMQEKYEQAIPYFSKTIRRNTSNDEAYAYRGYSYFLLEDYPAALVDFSMALAQNPSNETALFGEACLRWNIEDYRIAFLEFNQLIQINPNHDKAYYYRARAYLYQGDTINGLKDLSQALENDSCFIDTYYLLSSVLTSKKKYKQADYYLELALKCKNKSPL